MIRVVGMLKGSHCPSRRIGPGAAPGQRRDSSGGIAAPLTSFLPGARLLGTNRCGREPGALGADRWSTIAPRT